MVHILEQYNDEEFLNYAMYTRFFELDKQHRQSVIDYVYNRLKLSNLTIEFGCCGTNYIRRLDE